jgi:4-nitrophenyl phosphatase
MSSHPFSTIKALILDLDGVLWRGSEAIGNLPAIFSKIVSLRWRVVFATNNATRTVQQYVDVFSKYGVIVAPWQIITSADAVTRHLHVLFPNGAPVYIIGEQGLMDACASEGFIHSETSALAVIAGMDRHLTYEKLRTGTLLLRNGLPFIGTNPDHTFPSPEGLIPGAGSILAALSTASGVDPFIAGKPKPTMYQIALERFGLAPDQVMVVGDRPETDIAGAQALGCHTALVLSGVTTAEQAKYWLPAPDFIANDLTCLLELDRS